ncbi:MAG: ParA family protein [Deltaproteobacteria bacterium]|nr:ParA family protein [Deltaproteobacteria bacterium]
MGYVISIANQKGGVGKTTTSVNICASLAAVKRKCLLVDCDPQGNATTGLGFDRLNIENGLYDLIFGTAPEDETITKTILSRMQLIGATANLVGAEIEMHSMDQKETLLRRSLHTLRERYDYIFLDCPPSVGFLTVNALVASDLIIIPLQCEYYALEGLSQLLKTLKAVKRRLNPTLKLAGILLTMYDKRNNLSRQVADEVRAHFKKHVFRTVIPRNVRLSESPSYGKPVLLYDIHCKGAQSYISLAKELIKKGI